MVKEEHKKKIEAVLFTTGRFLSVQELVEHCGLVPEELVALLEELRAEYAGKESSLEIREESGRWKLNVRPEYGHITNKLASTSEFDKPTQKTLAIVTYLFHKNKKVIQSEVIKYRGNKAYDHIKNLKEAELVTSEKAGRTRELKLTQRFYDYFDINKDMVEKFITANEETKVNESNEERLNENENK